MAGWPSGLRRSIVPDLFEQSEITNRNPARGGGLAEWQCAGLENQWAKALAGSSPVPSAMGGKNCYT